MNESSVLAVYIGFHKASNDSNTRKIERNTSILTYSDTKVKPYKVLFCYVDYFHNILFALYCQSSKVSVYTSCGQIFFLSSLTE